MPNIIDELCPPTVGEKRIGVTLSEDTLQPRAFSPITLNVDYAACDPEGIAPPLELLITAPTEQDFRRVRFNRSAPSTISFQPREGGRHVIRIGEVGHNRWFGFIEIDVAGETATTTPVT